MVLPRGMEPLAVSKIKKAPPFEFLQAVKGFDAIKAEKQKNDLIKGESQLSPIAGDLSPNRHAAPEIDIILMLHHFSPLVNSGRRRT